MTIVALFMFILVVGGVIGWVANIVQIIALLADPITGLFVFKCVGVILAPLGSVLGIIGMF